MNELKHIGTPRHSGRYPWGSGKSGYQRNKSFLGQIVELEKQGLSAVEIAKGFNMSTTELRKKRTIAMLENRRYNVSEAFRLKEKGYSNTAIGKRMGVNESTVRSWLNPVLKEKAEIVFSTAEMLKDNVEKKGYLDIGLGTETHLGITRTKLGVAVSLLEEQGYTKYSDIKIKQPGTGKYTIYQVLAPPGSTREDVIRNRFNIKSISDYYTEDGGRSWLGVEPPTSVDRQRISVRYLEDGGKDKDGVIELRRGLNELSLGEKNYAQVRIGVDGKSFMKGMAMYSDDIPDGFDIVYNTKKPRGTLDKDVFKPMEKNPKDPTKIDPDNPFGSTIRQKHYIGPDGKEYLSPINIVGSQRKEGSGEEGDWGTWSRNLSSQILSKQSPALAKKQLGQAYDLKKDDYDEIMSLTNPGVKRILLKEFSDSCDSDAVHLKAAALPRQLSQVLLPIPSLKENEIYAPNFLPGENVVLIRHPHGGTFEIPELIVNNKNRDARRLIEDAEDAVGINPKVAARLSGADFDGDTVIVIPNREGKIRTTSPLKGLKDFDPDLAYPEYEGMKIMTERTKQHKMGEISNLITDMTIKGANEDEIARAVRHSMVVIDAVKHKLDYKRSYIENNISDLKVKYQGGPRSGAATIISRAKSQKHIPERKEGIYITDPTTGKKKRLYIDPETGEKLYTNTGRMYPERIKVKDPVTGKTLRDPVTGKPVYVMTGKMVKAMVKSTKMAEEKNAFKLSSGTTMEDIYAEHANSLKALGNKARKSMLEIEDIPYSKSARKVFEKEVAVLRSKLNDALRNKPQERQAILLTNKIVSAIRRANPDMEPEELKKKRFQALTESRLRMGAQKKPVQITDREWEAIQAGAISGHFLEQILLNTDSKALKQRAMPRYETTMSPARIARAKSMFAEGHTAGEIADVLGVSTTTLSKALE